MFKAKQKENIKLKEVCSNCCKPIEISASSETDPNRCCCYSAEPKQGEIAEQNLTPAATEESKVPSMDLGERFEVLEVIGYGGMGTVYRARDKELGKDFAIKVLKDELATDESAIKRFEQEANAASDLTHLNMLAVYGHGKTTAGSHYIIMDLLEGESLAQLLQREGKLDANRAINISIQVCQALAHAHMKGLVHRDLKPSNIMLVKSGSSVDLVKVLDFGIAKLMPGEKRETMNLTQTGEIFGSPSYMSPEQCLGLNQDARSDIYSLGCMMYEMLTGKPPLVGKNPIQTVAKHLNEEPVPVSKLTTSKIPQGLEATIMRCLEKEAEQRYQTMDHLSADLQLIASGLAPKQKKRKSQKLIDLLSVPLLAIYITVSVIIGCTGQESLQKSILVFWLGILSMYFWRWLTCKRELQPSSSEKWKRALVWSLFTAITLMIPFTTISLFNLQIPLRSDLECLFSLLMLCLTSLVIPITALGWCLSAVLSNPAVSSPQRRGIVLSPFILVPIAVAIFARPQIAWIPFRASQTLEHHNGVRLAGLMSSSADSLRNLSLLLNPEFIEAYYARGQRNSSEKKVDAINDFTKVIELSKSQQQFRKKAESVYVSRGLRKIAEIYFYEKQYDLALKHFNLLLNRAASEEYVASDHFLRGQCYEKLKSYQNALDDYNKAIGDQILNAYTARARLNAKLGNYAQAVSDYSTSIELQPELTGTRIARAAFYTSLGKKSLAMNDYRNIVSKYTGPEQNNNLDNSELYDTAVAFSALGENNKAATIFEMLKQRGYKIPADNGHLDDEEIFEPF